MKPIKLALNGKEINLTSDDININSTNFKVDKDGNVTSNNLTASNATINGTMTTTAPAGSKVQMANGAMVTYMANSNIGIEIGGSNIFVRSPNDGIRSGYIGGALTTSSGVKPLTIFGTNDKDIYLGTTSGDFESSGQRVTTALRISSDAVYNYLPITNASDKRLKYDIENIDTNIIKAISECEILQFKIKNRTGKISTGIIAQELIEKCEKHNVTNIFEYEIIKETQYLIDDETFYYVIDYEQYLILKTKAQEIELKNQQTTINDLIKRIERLEEKLNEKD